jgi:sec-independent protein translocase protein TatA
MGVRPIAPCVRASPTTRGPQDPRHGAGSLIPFEKSLRWVRVSAPWRPESTGVCALARSLLRVRGMRLGAPEMIIVLVIALLVFGPNKLPQLGDALGKSIRNFKKATDGHEPEAEPAPRAALAAHAPPQAAEAAQLAEEHVG